MLVFYVTLFDKKDKAIDLRELHTVSAPLVGQKYPMINKTYIIKKVLGKTAHAHEV